MSPRVALVSMVVGLLACSKPVVTPVPAPVEEIVGPSRLRRLSNSEYLNTLGDLFPALTLSLPPLPSETVVGGLENDTETQRPSDVLIARYEEIATRTAAAAVSTPASLRELTGCDGSDALCPEQLIARLGRRIFRRPLLPEEQERFVTQFAAWRETIDFEAAVELTLRAMLQSPHFIYRAEPAASPALGDVVPVEPYAMASRLSFFLWESGPDELLLEAAARNKLQTETQVANQAERMLRDPRVRRLYWSFHRQWLGLDRILQDEHAVRTPGVDPLWSPRSQTSALEETRLFISNELSDNGSLRTLLTSRRAWVDGEMSRLYGLPAPLDPGLWQEVSLDGTQRSGLLSRVAFLAGFSHRGATSPPIRANEIQLRLLCQLPRPPPPGLDTTPPKQPTEGAKTNRTLFEERTSPPMCAGCHQGLNGFGFGLEHYNAAGLYQATDQGLPVDATGRIVATDVDRPFDGAMDLAAGLSESAVVHQCATQLWLRYALGRALVEDEAPWLDRTFAQFMKEKGDVRNLIVAIASSPNFRKRRTEELKP